MKPDSRHSHSRQSGFSLVEILVGLVIGLLTTLVIMQVFSVFEGQKRTTTGTAEAQTNGSIALYTIGRDLKMAGYGLMPVTDSPLECTDPTVAAAIAPVTITDGGNAAGASDRVTIRYGSSNMGGIPTPINNPITATDVTVDNSMGCQAGDTAMIITGSACNITSVSAVPNTTTVELQSTTGALSGSNLACLGTWNVLTYAINNGNLERSGVPSITDIVNIQAQYGISATANSNQIVQWVNATGGTWAAPTAANRNLIKSVHIAVVARNGLLEKTNVTSTCTTAKGTINNGPCAWDDTIFDAAPKIDLSNDPDWQRYRYRVFETIIPLRNTIWSKDTL